MKYESGETESPEIKLSEIQNPIFTEPKDVSSVLLEYARERETKGEVSVQRDFSGFSKIQNPIYSEPKDASPGLLEYAREREAKGEAPVQRDFSGFSKIQNPIYSEPKDASSVLLEYAREREAKGETPVQRDFSGFSKIQNDSFGITIDHFEKDVPKPTGDYTGPSTDALDIKIENAVKDLTFAQEQLERAIASGTGVITASTMVETAQKLLDSYVEQHAQAVAGEARQAAQNVSAKSEGTGEIRLGSVSHATWELEQAHKSGNSIRIHNAERELAHEKAKEAAKK